MKFQGKFSRGVILLYINMSKNIRYDILVIGKKVLDLLKYLFIII